jgi:hypothetical protein
VGLLVIDRKAFITYFRYLVDLIIREIKGPGRIEDSFPSPCTPSPGLPFILHSYLMGYTRQCILRKMVACLMDVNVGYCCDILAAYSQSAFAFILEDSQGRLTVMDLNLGQDAQCIVPDSPLSPGNPPSRPRHLCRHSGALGISTVGIHNAA